MPHAVPLARRAACGGFFGCLPGHPRHHSSIVRERTWCVGRTSGLERARGEASAPFANYRSGIQIFNSQNQIVESRITRLGVFDPRLPAHRRRPKRPKRRRAAWFPWRPLRHLDGLASDAWGSSREGDAIVSKEFRPVTGTETDGHTLGDGTEAIRPHAPRWREQTGGLGGLRRDM